MREVVVGPHRFRQVQRGEQMRWRQVVEIPGEGEKLYSLNHGAVWHLCDRVVELEDARAQPATERTHYDECWRQPGHHNCAVQEVERLGADLVAVRKVEDWVRQSPLTREIMPRIDGAFNAMEATGGPTDAYRTVACGYDLAELGRAIAALEGR